MHASSHQAVTPLRAGMPRRIIQKNGVTGAAGQQINVHQQGHDRIKFLSFFGRWLLGHFVRNLTHMDTFHGFIQGKTEQH